MRKTIAQRLEDMNSAEEQRKSLNEAFQKYKIDEGMSRCPREKKSLVPEITEALMDVYPTAMIRVSYSRLNEVYTVRVDREKVTIDTADMMDAWGRSLDMQELVGHVVGTITSYLSKPKSLRV